MMNNALFIAYNIDFNSNELVDAVNYLDTKEFCRYQRIKIEKDKIIYALSRKMLKLALSKYYPNVDKTDWIFLKNSYGKPFIQYPKLPKPLYFNISHTIDAIAIVISQSSDVGVDIERIRSLDVVQAKSTSHLNISKSFFTESEYKKIATLPYDEGFILFWKLWTLKEAYIKYRGMGLSLGLNCIDINVSANSIFINSHDIDVSIHQWIKNDIIISLCLSKALNHITIFEYDTLLTFNPINDYQHIHN
ncbi:4'-phosphopantetheinyl transferase superfamily protein [uncultured Gilliamella sp.]|uniref:4'-phosphopantetheinyl transferase family protein n=1 Tax=uncultured Gilliamella sp. TaxID=1193505 RepID=UPI0025DA921F|nr:4'-phosphopantetheinyl transferase superfamily protein [uncultured Gilliamella sp.]